MCHELNHSVARQGSAAMRIENIWLGDVVMMRQNVVVCQMCSPGDSCGISLGESCLVAIFKLCHVILDPARKTVHPTLPQHNCDILRGIAGLAWDLALVSLQVAAPLAQTSNVQLYTGRDVGAPSPMPSRSAAAPLISNDRVTFVPSGGPAVSAGPSGLSTSPILGIVLGCAAALVLVTVLGRACRMALVNVLLCKQVACEGSATQLRVCRRPQAACCSY